MEFSERVASLEQEARVVSRVLNSAFPMPARLLPHAAGVDISDASIKWMVLKPAGDRYRVEQFGEEPLPEGVVESGIIRDQETLARSLAEMKKKLGGIRAAHAALPEEAAYVFNMHVPEHTSREQVLRMIEFEFEGRVPIPPSSAVYDFDRIQRHDEGGEEIGVSVFPRDLSETYVSAFEAAGITLLSLELEARSIARTVSSPVHHDGLVTLLVDFGRARTGFAVLKRGIPIFTSTVEVGGDVITRALMQKKNLSEADAIAYRNDLGLLAEAGKTSSDAVITPIASMLADEVARHYRYWDSRRNDRGERVTPVGRVLLVGGSANLKGLSDFISTRTQARTEIGNVWEYVCDFDTYIPPIDAHHALQYATAIGLALRAV